MPDISEFKGQKSSEVCRQTRLHVETRRTLCQRHAVASQKQRRCVHSGAPPGGERRRRAGDYAGDPAKEGGGEGGH